MIKFKVKNIIAIVVLSIVVIGILKIFNNNYYKINMEKIPKKSILGYKISNSNNSYTLLKFMKLVSEESYEEAFNMLNSNNKKDMFNNDVEKFMQKIRIFRNSYSQIEYSTILRTEQKAYIDEDILCMLCDENKKIKHSVRVSIRTYKNNKSANLIIISID